MQKIKNNKKTLTHTIIFTIAILLMVCSLQPIFAENQTVDPGATPTTDVKNNISAAINAPTINNGDTITINAGTYKGSGNNTNLNINKNLTIQSSKYAGLSNQDTIIDAENQTRIFNIGNGYNVTFLGIIFINGNVTGANNGGAINQGTNGMLTITNCSFIDNKANNGGAIYSTGTMIVHDSNFTNNYARSEAGALYNRGGNDSYISGCVFKNNIAFASSGGLYIFNSSNVTVYGCNFTNTTINSSAGTGGAITINVCRNISISSCVFTENEAVVYGGAIRSVGNNYTFINNCTFNNNGASAPSLTGGAVSIQSNDRSSITDCIFNNNTGYSAGGILITTSKNMSVSNCTFNNNTAAVGAGGGILITTSQNMSVSNCTFNNNTATVGNGGGMTVADSIDVFITNCTFNNNTATSGNCGGFNTNARNVLIINCIFNNNTATNGTGGGLRSLGVNCTVINSTFYNNTANYAGAIFNNGDMALFGNIMANNTATTLGNVIYNNGTMGVFRLTYLSNSTIITKQGSNVTVYATLTDDMGNPVTGQDISFYVNGSFIENVTSIEGKANTTYLVTQGPVSLLPVTGDYAGHDGFAIVTLNGQLSIPKIPTNITVNVTKNLRVGNTTTITSRLVDDKGNPIANATVDFYVGGQYIGSAVTDANGIAKINHTFTKSGSFQVSAKYAGNDTFIESNNINQTTVSKIKTTTTIVIDGDIITATVIDEFGNPVEGVKVTFRVKGVVIGVGITDANGQATIYYKGADQKNVTATFDGNDKYYGSYDTFNPETPEDDSVNDGVGGKNVHAGTAKTTNNVLTGTTAMKDTGLPIVAILLVLLTGIALLGYRKRE